LSENFVIFKGFCIVLDCFCVNFQFFFSKKSVTSRWGLIPSPTRHAADPLHPSEPNVFCGWPLRACLYEAGLCFLLYYAFFAVTVNYVEIIVLYMLNNRYIWGRKCRLNIHTSANMYLLTEPLYIVLCRVYVKTGPSLRLWYAGVCRFFVEIVVDTLKF